jgi:hypothetical protein
VVDDRDYSSTLLLVEGNQNDVESTLSASSEGRLDYLLLRAAYRSQTAENPKARHLGLNDHPSSAVGREL